MINLKKILTHTLLLVFAMTIAIQYAHAVAPSDEVIAKWKKDGVYAEKMAWLNDFHERGGCSPVEQPLFKRKNSLATGTQAVDTIRVVVLLVDFSDHPYDGQQLAGTPADFDSILFSSGYHNPTGSMTDFYLENSYGNFYIQGDIFGWYRMPLTYATYAGTASGLQTTGINAQDLVDDALDAADADVNFSNYDFNGDLKCDGVILIHSGPGAEITGSTGDIWSHKWNIKNPRVLDAVQVYNYNMNPEEYGTGGGAQLSPIGVFCHEYGHFLGLPDLYDTDQNHTNSEGLGRWSLMASGNYNGNSKTPAHFDPWCKDQIGFLTLIEPTDNLYNVSIPAVEYSPVAYKLRNSISGSSEFFVVENRQKKGFDSQLPASGLLIYHVDETRSSNTDFTRYKVGLEQADGLNQLALAGSNGDGGDPYPGSTNNREFHQYSLPNSYLYNGFESEMGVWNISNSDSIMTVDFDVAYSRPWIETVGVTPFVMVDQDLDGILEPGETVQFFFSVRNQMRPGQNVHATLSSDNSGLVFSTNNVTVPGAFGPSLVDNASFPIEFTIPDTISPHIDSFFLEITTDSLDGGTPVTGSATYTKTFGFEYTIGSPNILIVDADRGDSLQLRMENSLYSARVPTDTWDKNISGTPTLNDLMGYDMVFWHTGDTASAGNAISIADINVMKQYLDNNKNLMLSTLTGVDDIMTLDSTFLIDYLHARPNANVFYPQYDGVTGNPVGDNLIFQPGSNPFAFYNIKTLIPTGNGQPAFTSNNQTVGVTTDGTYKSLLVTFAADMLENDVPGRNTQADFMAATVNFFGGISTDVYDGSPFDRLPTNFDLSQNYPNPFNPTTTIKYTIRPTKERGAITTLEVFNMIGQKVTTLVNKAQIPGNYEVTWDGTDSHHNEVASGIYFYRLTRGNENSTKKMTLLK